MFAQQSARRFDAMQSVMLLVTVLSLIASAVAAEENTGNAPDATAVSAGIAPTAAANETTPNPPPAEPATEVVSESTTPAGPEATPTAPVSQAAAPETSKELAAPVPPQAETASAPPPLGQKRAGFAVEIFFGVDKPLVAFDDDFIDFSMINGGLFLGGKIGKVIVGMSFEMSRLKHRRNETYPDYYGNDYSGNYESSATTFVFKPGVRFDLAQSKDKKVDLFGQIDFGAGTVIYKDDNQDRYDDNDEKYLLLDWDLGPGVRYWAHPQFAVAAVGGLQGNFFLEHDTADDAKYSYHLLGIFASLQIVGVF